jgi:diguanylate cyclase (GGDEF)-like protein
LDTIRTALRAGQAVHEKVLNYAKSGAPYWMDLRIFPLRDDAGTITHYVAIEQDVTMDRRPADELAELADRDTLTGIPNRGALLTAIEAQIAAARARRAAGARCAGPCVALINIDRLDHVNETFGHQAGDAVLYGVADRLAASIRRADLLGRLGGGEFAICMPHVPLAGATDLAETIRAAVNSEPFDTPNGPVRVAVSIGVAELAAGANARDMIGQADLALHRAKRSGRNRVRHDAYS